jgi:hypothetical protein
MILYHFTSPAHWERIQSAAVLKPTDPQLNPHAHFPTLAGQDEDGMYFLARPSEEGYQVLLTSPNPLFLPEVLEQVPEHDLGPLVVWFTSEPRSDAQRWAGDAYEKYVVRITVDVPEPDVRSWPRWAKAQGIPDEWYKALAESGGNPRDWYVVERPVPKSEWIDVTDMRSGNTLWRP